MQFILDYDEDVSEELVGIQRQERQRKCHNPRIRRKAPCQTKILFG
jgi:hypothetical protein